MKTSNPLKLTQPGLRNWALLGFALGRVARPGHCDRARTAPDGQRGKRCWVVPTVLGLVLGSFGVAVFAQTPPKAEPWKAPARAAGKENPIPADPKSLAPGKDLFVLGCVPCHGPTGRGDGPAAATLERDGVRIRPGNLSLPQMWEQTDGELFWKISEGRSPMPTWKQSLSEEQRWQIINYVRTLAPRVSDTNVNLAVKTSPK
jgi:mono/diheme cytochrome c family protein